ncbi:MAG: hypothetical protein MOIL_00036 [Candidatus Methanolliviera sp. GoM_oil]|nr:MAG: hypothetical protein MOIL_00036 [Candidatus Methanolliviera sp. GoM_oil]
MLKVIAPKALKTAVLKPAQSENLAMVCSFSPDDFVVGSQKSKIFEDLR